MKKLTLASISIMLALFASAQTYKLASESVNTQAIAEDPHNPLVNGIPYTQYKAQQDALKQKQAAENKAAKQQAAVILPVTAINPEDLKNIRKEEKPVVTQPASKGSN